MFECVAMSQPIFQNKIIAITGGTGGIGLALARHMLHRGARKISLLDKDYYDEEVVKLNEDFPNQKVLFHLTDVAKRHELERAIRETVFVLGGIDVLFTCAGVLSEGNIDEMIDVNLVSLSEWQ